MRDSPSGSPSSAIAQDRFQRDAGVTVVVRILAAINPRHTGRLREIRRNSNVRTRTQHHHQDFVNYEGIPGAYRINGRGLTTGDVVIVKIDGAIVAGVERSSRNVLPSLGVVNVS